MPMASTAYLTVERRQEAKKKKGKPHIHQEAKQQIDVDTAASESCFEQKNVRELYNTPEIQFSVAFLIFLNFISEAANAQILPEDGSDGQYVFLIFEFVFNISFTIELAWNMYGSWFLKFWDSGWNWFDFVIVVVSLLAMLLPGLPGISVLRLFRAFRVFRLFKRIKSLKKIIEGVLGALPGVSQAFMVLGILMGIWSVIGVEFFRELMPEFFGTFIKGMYTLFQIMTMDSWSSGIARVIIFEHGQPMAAVFFISYIFIAGIVMTNVVVAILLDKYLEAIDKDKEEERQEKEAAEALDAELNPEDPTKPEVQIFAMIDGEIEPLRSITWAKYHELEIWLDEAAKRIPRKREDSDSEPETEDDLDEDGEGGGKESKAMSPMSPIPPHPDEPHTGGDLFFEETNSPKNIFGWDTSNVLTWLSFIGFNEYYDKFKSEAIDGPTLTQLNESDLKDLGMKLLRRKQFMQALYELLADSQWPESTDEIFRPNNRARPASTVVRNSIIRHNNFNPHPAGLQVEEERMFFHESRIPNSSSPNRQDGVQMTEVRRHPQSRLDSTHQYDSEFIQE